MENQTNADFIGGNTIMNVIELYIKEKKYKGKNDCLAALKEFQLYVKKGEKIAIVGESGTGKSTLLNILGLLDQNYVGEYRLFGSGTNHLNANEMAKIRNQRIGFVLQESALINSFSIEDNIKLPFLYATAEEYDRGYFEEIIHSIKVDHILEKKPLECSGGEKARAVFARAVMMKPQIILADEPTSSLDIENRDRIMNLLFKMNREYGTTIITVTHDLEVANRHDRVIQLN